MKHSTMKHSPASAPAPASPASPAPFGTPLASYPLVDSHCHLDYPPLSADYVGVLARAKAANIGAMLTIATQPSKFEENLALIGDMPHVACALGVHPHNSGDNADFTTADLIRYCRHPKVVAIGESGLDYHYNHSPKDIQRTLFLRHIEAAREMSLPLIIHSRDAEGDSLSILQEEMGKGAFKPLLHCFSSKDCLARGAVELGAYVSFSGILTFPKADAIRETARWIPENRLLIETDSPYLAPVPMRGRSNEPSFIVHTLAFLAKLRNKTIDEMARITSDNFFRLFSKMPRPSCFLTVEGG